MNQPIVLHYSGFYKTADSADIDISNQDNSIALRALKIFIGEIRINLN